MDKESQVENLSTGEIPGNTNVPSQATAGEASTPTADMPRETNVPSQAT